MRRWKNFRFVFVIVVFSFNLAHSTSTRYTTSQNNRNVRTSPSHHQQVSTNFSCFLFGVFILSNSLPNITQFVIIFRTGTISMNGANIVEGYDD